MRVLKKCDYCGVKFESVRPNARWCCVAHRKRGDAAISRGEPVPNNKPIVLESSKLRKLVKKPCETPKKPRDRSYLLSIRPCHDCGKHTTDYRCSKCLAKWRIKHGISQNARDGGYL